MKKPFLIGSSVLIKETGEMAIVVGDYSFLSNCIYTSDDSAEGYDLCLALLDSDKDRIVSVRFWVDPYSVELIRTPLSVLRNNLLKLYNFYHC